MKLDDLVDVAKRVYVKKQKMIINLENFTKKFVVIRNKIRTHLRNEYPDQFKRITRIGESELNEMIDLVHVYGT